MYYNAHKYQDYATSHVIQNPASALFMEMGLGKTVATLTAIDRLVYEDLAVSKVLVIAPKFVALNVWAQEGAKWDHLKHLTFSIITGDPRQRVAALKAKADIYVINRENVTWLVNYYKTAFPFDMLVIDELSSFKSAQAQRFKSLRIVRPLIKRVVGLTGTPAPNSLADLWPQIYLLDQGQRLGKTLTGFREAYLTPDKTNGYQVYSYKARKGAEKEIYDRIGDICISMKEKDYLELPEMIEQDFVIHLDPVTQAKYDQFEADQVTSILDAEITAFNAAALTNKLLQFSNGALYDADRGVHEVHDIKLDALDELVEQASGPVLIFYSYIHDRQRIKARHPGTRELKTTRDIEDWNAGKIPVMIAHPASAGHGLNLQAGGNIIIWFGLTWSLELYLQANARLHRQGQTKPVVIYRLICSKTMDLDAARTLARKADGQAALMEAVKARVNLYKKSTNLAKK